jgi:hypothetical protein
MEISSAYDAASANIMRQEAQLKSLSEEIASGENADTPELIGKIVELDNAESQTQISMTLIKTANEMYDELLSNLPR